MKKKSLKIDSLCDGLKLDVTLFEPDGKINGIIQLSHGMVEHKEYYYDFMKYMCNNGYVCIINDHRGHGKSVKDKNDYGYFYEKNAEYVVEDLHQITLYVKSIYPNKRVILLGHSMGSLIVRKYIKKYDYEISGLIVCGSPSINPMSKVGYNLSKIVSTLFGERYRSKLLNKLALGANKNNEWLSYDMDYVNKYSNDPLCGFIFTANGFINLTKLMIDVYSKDKWILKNKNLKILFIAGLDDIIIKSEEKWNESIDFLYNVGYKNIERKIYPNMKHALLLEKNKEIVYEDVLNFVKKI